jgi:general secretion pathway protein K
MRDSKGIALLIVLWALLLLGTLGMSFSFAMRTEAKAARNGLDGSRAYYQARTGINRVIALISSASLDNVLRVPITGEEEDAVYEARIASEGGKIDINLVAEETLKEILRKGGLSPEEAESVGDSILDWRDGDDVPRAKGAESPYYLSLPAPVKPPNGKLAAVDELLSVKGVTPDLYGRFLYRVFTVHGKSLSVDINEAPVEVLRVLPGFTAAAADAVVSRRLSDPFRSPAEVAIFLAEVNVPATTVKSFSTTSLSRVYTITSVGKVGRRISRAVACRVEIGAGGPKSVKIVRWMDYVAVGEGN